MQNDFELVQRARAGDKEAFGELVRRYQALVYTLAHHHIGSFVDAQDVAQEAFIKAFRKLGQLQQPDRFAAWLKAITANECKMWLRNRRPTVSLGDIESLPYGGSVAAETWRRQERQTAVAQAVDSLPEKNRLVVTLHYLAGYSYEEIGRLLGVTRATVLRRLYRARQQLRAELMEQIEEGYEMAKLPQDFAQEVLRKLTLSPVEDGWISVSYSSDVKSLIAGVESDDGETALLAFAMRPEDADAVLSGLSFQAGVVSKARAIDSMRQALDAFDIRLWEVVLYLDEGGQCRARVTFRQARTEHCVDWRPSAALALAVRVKAPVYVEEPVIRQGKVGEDGLTPEIQESLEALKAELQAATQYTQLEGKAFEIGLAPEEGMDTVRYQKDDSAGTLRIEVSGSDSAPLVLPLDDYRLGVDQLWRIAEKQADNTGFEHNGREYRVRYTSHADEIEARFEREGQI